MSTCDLNGRTCGCEVGECRAIANFNATIRASRPEAWSDWLEQKIPTRLEFDGVNFGAGVRLSTVIGWALRNRRWLLQIVAAHPELTHPLPIEPSEKDAEIARLRAEVERWRDAAGLNSMAPPWQYPERPWYASTVRLPYFDYMRVLDTREELILRASLDGAGG